MTSDKKRKRLSNSLHSPTNPVSVVHAEVTSYPPIIATTRGVALPQLPFTPFVAPDTTNSSSKKRARHEYLLHASNPRLEYTGRETPDDKDFRHYIGIYDTSTSSISLHLAPKLHISSSINSHRARDAEVAERGSKHTYDESRTALGKAFGTRKAQAALTSREINRVDVGHMDKRVSEAIVKRVEEETKDIPTSEMLGQALVEEKPIPKYDKDAKEPAKVYWREDVITEEEWVHIWISDWTKAGEATSKSSYVANRANPILKDTAAKKQTTKLKVLKYIGWLVEFYTHSIKSRGRIGPLAKAKNVIPNAGPVVLEGLYKKFAEVTTDPNTKSATAKDAERYTVSPRLENKILYYMAVLCLMVDNYEVDIYDLKQDLNIPPKELSQAFKEVGCTVRELTKVQTAQANMTKADAAQHKRAVLKVPLEFPSLPRRRAVPAGRR